MRKQRRKSSFPVFWSGFATALVLALALLGAGVYFLLSHGFTVYLDSEEVSRLVRDQVVEQAKKDLPRIIEEAKLEIPRIVEEEMRDQLTSDRMEIAGFVFRVPEELMSQLKANMQENVERATAEILDGIDTDEVAEKFGADVYAMVNHTLFSELHGQIFEVMAFDRLPVRVRVGVRGE